MQIPALICVLHFVNLGDNAEILHHRRGPPVSRLCPAGCTSCSAMNGCLSCKPRLFFHLERDAMWQRGTCLTSCPQGYYGTRSPHISTCSRCRGDCKSCFSEHFCTRCHPGHFLFRGKCDNSCPNGLTANATLRECTECSTGCEVCVRDSVCVRCRAGLYLLHGRCHFTCPTGFRPDLPLMQCRPSRVHCEAEEWTHAGRCVQRRSMKPYRRGQESPARHVLW